MGLAPSRYWLGWRNEKRWKPFFSARAAIWVTPLNQSFAP